MRRLLLCSSFAVLTWVGIGHAQDASPTAGDLVARGRVHAAADRHGDAVADLLEAVSLDRTLLPTVAREIAYQTLWREDADTAVRYFRTWLSLNPGNADKDVLAGLALALSWSGRQSEAVALYRRLVAEYPEDGAIRVGLGRTLLWDNRLNSGFTELRRVERDFPADTAPNREAGRFLMTVLDEYDTPLGLRYETSTDSDDLNIGRIGAWAAGHVGQSFLGTVAPSRTTFDQAGRPDVEAWRLRAGLAGPLASDVSLHLSGWLDSFRGDGPDTWSGADQLEWDPFGYDGWLTWVPHARLRLDAGAGRQPLEAMSPLSHRVILTSRSLSSDWRLARWWTASGAVAHADYSDGNRRWSWTGRLQWRREGRVELWAGPTATLLDFARPGDGYWSPDQMKNLSFEARARTRGRSWIAEVSGRLGIEKGSGDESVSIGGASAHLGYRFAAGALVSLDAGHSRSRVTGSGYNRDFGALTVRLFH